MYITAFAGELSPVERCTVSFSIYIQNIMTCTSTNTRRTWHQRARSTADDRKSNPPTRAVFDLSVSECRSWLKAICTPSGRRGSRDNIPRKGTGLPSMGHLVSCDGQLNYLVSLVNSWVIGAAIAVKQMCKPKTNYRDCGNKIDNNKAD